MQGIAPTLMTSKTFKSKTTPSNILKRGRSSLVTIDEYLKKCDQMQTLPVGDKIALLTLLLVEIRKWKQLKAAKTSTNSTMRKAEVDNLGTQAFACLRYFAFERNKQTQGINHDMMRQMALKSMTKGYDLERATYLSSNKQVALSGSTASHVAKFRDQFGLQGDKPFDQLSEQEFRDLLSHQLVREAMQTQVKFMTKIERIERLLYIEGNGLFYNKPFEPFDTKTGGEEKFPYVIDEYGNIYSIDHDQYERTLSLDSRFNHSTFNAGKDVISAGLISIIAGQLRYISNHSGHYKPSHENVLNALLMLQASGADLSRARVEVMEMQSNKLVLNGWRSAAAFMSGLRPDETFSES